MRLDLCLVRSIAEQVRSYFPKPPCPKGFHMSQTTGRTNPYSRISTQNTGVFASLKIEHLIADRNAHAAISIAFLKHPERQILQRKIRLRIIRRLHPTPLSFRTQTHPISFRPSTGSSNEHDPKLIANSRRTFSI